jgi:hypothetical protein
MLGYCLITSLVRSPHISLPTILKITFSATRLRVCMGCVRRLEVLFCKVCDFMYTDSHGVQRGVGWFNTQQVAINVTAQPFVKIRPDGFVSIFHSVLGILSCRV